jgi:hypothetical protein
MPLSGWSFVGLFAGYLLLGAFAECFAAAFGAAPYLTRPSP